MDEILSGTRIEIDKEKKNPADFVLWKRSDEGLAWDSPWGKGRPGWHIECSAMSMDALGESFDIHAGGSDLKFPHHENEIAQSESATGNKFAKYWMHTGPLRIDKKKMSKSLDNFLTIRDALKNYPYEIIRYFLLSSHYRSPVNYSEVSLEEAKAALDRLYTSIHDVDISKEEVAAEGPHAKQFQQAMDDDFNVPEALAVLFDLAKAVNIAKENGDQERTRLLVNELIHLSKPLGLLQQDPEIFLKSGVNVNESEIEALIDKREKARDSGDYSAADEIRDQLFEQNIILEDSKEGTFWRRR
jgi:cysteinyl-tRNA synthetase